MPRTWLWLLIHEAFKIIEWYRIDLEISIKLRTYQPLLQVCFSSFSIFAHQSPWLLPFSFFSVIRRSQAVAKDWSSGGGIAGCRPAGGQGSDSAPPTVVGVSGELPPGGLNAPTAAGFFLSDYPVSCRFSLYKPPSWWPETRREPPQSPSLPYVPFMLPQPLPPSSSLVPMQTAPHHHLRLRLLFSFAPSRSESTTKKDRTP